MQTTMMKLRCSLMKKMRCISAPNRNRNVRCPCPIFDFDAACLTPAIGERPAVDSQAQNTRMRHVLIDGVKIMF